MSGGSRLAEDRPALCEIVRPGVEAGMQNQPDHGEYSYRGSGRLSGKTALIAVAPERPLRRGRPYPAGSVREHAMA